MWSMSFTSLYVLRVVIHSVLSISQGIFSPNNSWKTYHNSHVEMKYGVSNMSSKSDRSFMFDAVVLCVIQWSVVITQSKIVRYYINNYRNWGRLSIKCWIYKRHPIPRPNGRAMGWLFVNICEKIGRVIMTSHCIMFLYGDTSRVWYYMKGRKLKLDSYYELTKDTPPHTLLLWVTNGVSFQGFFPFFNSIWGMCELKVNLDW